MNLEQINKSTNHERFVFLITSVDAYGHVNAATGVGSILANHGHKVYYLGTSKHRSLTEKRGLTFLAIEDYVDELPETGDNGFINEVDKSNYFVQIVQQFSDFLCQTPINKFNQMKETIKTNPKFVYDQFTPIFEEISQINDILGTVVDQINPHAIFTDILFTIPYLLNCKPYHILVNSLNPIHLYPGRAPGFGLSTSQPKEIWEEHFKLMEPWIEAINFLYKQLYDKFNLQPVTFQQQLETVRDFGVYIYPEAVDYKELGRPREKWFRIDSVITKENSEKVFEIPDSLKHKPGKIILFSAGTLASSVISMMQPLLDSLGKSPHRFIVSKGPYGDMLKLCDNCWGENYIDQATILPHVDLVITHGGNNTFVETLAAGKPMIVIPLFGDQVDNAQRSADLGLGQWFWPFDYDEDKFLQAIDELANDDVLREKLSKIAETINTSSSRDRFVEIVEHLIKTGKLLDQPFN